MNFRAFLKPRRTTQLRKLFSFITILSMIFAFFQPEYAVHATTVLTLTPITWNVVGLDSNNVNVGPSNFPVGVRACNEGTELLTNITSRFDWDSADAMIDLRTDSTVEFVGSMAVPELAAGACTDFYYEISVMRDPAAYNHTRRYHVTADSDETAPVTSATPREIYVERLVSQNRNAVTDVKLDGVSVPNGGTLSLQIGSTYDIQLIGNTATNGYNQLESFINLPNTVFRINSITSSYAVTSQAPPYNRLYADSCGWDNNPLSPTYRSCISSDGKSGGAVTTNYNVTVISGAGGSQSLNTLLYDFSGSSFHYNSDFSSSARYVSVVSPLRFSKAFSPTSVVPGGLSTLTFTLANPGTSAVNEVSFRDDLPANPAQMLVSADPNVTVSGCGAAPVLSAAQGSSWVSITGADIAAGATCTFRVSVTAPLGGEYANTSGILSINGVDTGLTASANLTAADAITGTGLSCTTRNLAQWTMGTGAGITAPPAYFQKSADVSSAVASFYSADGGQSIDTANGNPANSWAGYGWGKTGTPNIDTATHFQIRVDTSQYSTVGISLDATANTNWGPNGNNMFVYSSTTGAAGSFTQIGSTIALTKNTWTGTNYSFDAAAVSPTFTYFRIGAVGASSIGSNATLMLDNITVTGCGLPIQPTLTKAFAPASIAAGDVSTLTFTLSNPNSVNLTGAAFTDPLPSGLVVADDPAASNTCAAVFNPGDGDTSLVLIGATIPAAGSCTASVNVTAAAQGSYQNVSGQISTTELGTNSGASGSAVAALNVLSAPGFTKRFSPDAIYAGQDSTLTFTLYNANTEPLTGAAFTDTLPAGMQVASTPEASSTCADAVFAPTAAAGNLSFSGGTIPANGSCTAQVNVTAALVSDYTNTTSALTTAVSNLTAAAAMDVLSVIAHYPGLKLSKQVASSSDGPWTSFITVAPGNNVYYRLTVENIGDVDLTSVVVTDPTVDLSDCPLRMPFDLPTSSPTAACSIGPIAAQAGNTLNTATAQGTYDNQVYSSTATAEYLGVNSVSGFDLTLIKQVGDTPTGPWSSAITGVSTGAPLYYKFVMINSGDSSLSDLSIDDPLLATDPIIQQNITDCTWIDPLPEGQASVCVVGPVTAADGTLINTATANAGTPVIASLSDSATYTSGSSSITGTVWGDQDSNGVIDGGEPGLFNVILNLYLDEGDGNFDAETDTFLGSQYSAADGSYAFNSLPDGTYFVNVAGGVAGYALVSGGTNPRKIILAGDSSGNNFGYLLPSADLAVSITNDVTTLDAGGSTTYTIRVTNVGSIAVTDAMLRDLLSSGLVGITAICSIEPGNQCDGDLINSTALTGSGISLPTLAPGEFYEIELTANVTAGSGSVTSTATVAVPDGTVDTVPSNNTSVDTDSIDLVADLAVSKTNGVAAVNAGASTIYTIRVTNAGPSTVSGATLLDTMIPGELAAESVICASALNNQCDGTVDLTALTATGLTLPDLAAGAFYEISLTADLTAGSGLVTNTAAAAVPAGTTDPIAGNNTVQDTDTVREPADLAVTITNGASSLEAGTATTYTIRVTNNGLTPVDEAVLNDVLGTGLSAGSVVCAIVDSNQCDGIIDLTALTGGGIILPVLAPGEFYEIELTANVTAIFGTVTSTTTVTLPGSSYETDPSNNTGADEDPVNSADPEADLSVTKTDGNISVGEGHNTTYRIRVTNAGPSAADGAILQDILGAGLDAAAVVCTVADNNQCETAPSLADLIGGGLALPNLASGDFYAVDLTTSVTAVSGTVTNSASITVPTGMLDPNAGNNLAADTDTVDPLVEPADDLEVIKTNGAASVESGSTVTYMIQVTNHGPSLAAGVLLKDTLGSGLAAVSAACTSVANNQCGGTVDWSALTGSGIILPDLASGQIYRINLVAEVMAAGGAVSNAAAITPPGGFTDTNPGNNSSTDTDTVTLANYVLFIPILHRSEELVVKNWQVGLGYEDLSLSPGGNDYDYNDWNVSISGAVTYASVSSNIMRRIDLAIAPRARGATYDHKFQLTFPAHTFASDGTATLTLYDRDRHVISTQERSFDSGANTTFIIFPKTSEALPGSMVNTKENGAPVLPQRFAELSIVFDTPFAFDVTEGEFSLPHGQGLFFDPTLVVINTGNLIHGGDVRLLSVPSSTWLWPEEKVRIDRAYPMVTYAAGNPPSFTFPDAWWTKPNTCVYDGVKCPAAQ